jgi:non-homologous end joining protein Ku
MTKDMKTFGSRAEVFHKTAKKTAGGLTFSDLEKNKNGRIVSKKLAALARKSIKKNLFAKGYKPKKGKFVVMRKSMKKGKKGKKGTRSRK